MDGRRFEQSLAAPLIANQFCEKIWKLVQKSSDKILRTNINVRWKEKKRNKNKKWRKLLLQAVNQTKHGNFQTIQYINELDSIRALNSLVRISNILIKNDNIVYIDHIPHPITRETHFSSIQCCIHIFNIQYTVIWSKRQHQIPDTAPLWTENIINFLGNFSF